MCIPSLLESLGPHILRSHMNTTQFKPIPNNERVDLAGFRVKEPVEWVIDDVVAWMLDVARTKQVPFEDVNMHKFACLDGKQLLRMSEQQFCDRDPSYGHLFYQEFRKLLAVSSEEAVIDDAMRRFRDSEDEPSAKSTPLPPHIPSTAVTPAMSIGSPQRIDLSSPQSVYSASAQALSAGIAQSTALHNAQNLQQTMQQNLQQNLQPTLQQNIQEQLQNSFQQNLQQNLQQNMQQNISTGLQLAQSIVAANNLANLSNNISLQQMQAALSPHSPMVQSHLSPLPQQQKLLQKYAQQQASTSPGVYDSEDDIKITRNKDGRPRKRSHHTKGNKLWEFIRDALKDPITCPSIVRWEDPVEGVFRIVESEKLARLWGERKNNQKMTYEKLSRAMRTYYEKQILVPVPKTGLYPKKLVYKFGPGAHGWEMTKREPV